MVSCVKLFDDCTIKCELDCMVSPEGPVHVMFGVGSPTKEQLSVSDNP